MLAGPGCPTTSVIEKVYLKETETSPTWDTPYILPSNLGVCTLHNSAGTAASDDEKEIPIRIIQGKMAVLRIILVQKRRQVIRIIRKKWMPKLGIHF